MNKQYERILEKDYLNETLNEIRNNRRFRR